MKLKNIWVSLLVVILLAAVGWIYYELFFTNFHTVVENRFYRSRQLSKSNLEKVIAKYHIRTIVNLRCNSQDDNFDQEIKGEIEVAERLGISYFCFELVSKYEADPKNMKLSVNSPIGRALLGHKKGDAVEVEVPVGKIVYKIIRVK